MIVAIDGPAGSGKSSVCRCVAERLGYTYLDTGAMYRAVAWALHMENRDLEEEDAGAVLGELPLRFSLENGALAVIYRGERLDHELRSPEVTRRASEISRMGSVRAHLTRWQRALAKDGRVVAEGRDMTTVVFPDAPVKIYLTADLPTRAQRRFREYEEKGVPVDYESLKEQIRDRDEADRSRETAPLTLAPDAFYLDTSHLPFEEVVRRVLRFISQKSQNCQK